MISVVDSDKSGFSVVVIVFFSIAKRVINKQQPACVQAWGWAAAAAPPMRRAGREREPTGGVPDFSTLYRGYKLLTDQKLPCAQSVGHNRVSPVAAPVRANPPQPRQTLFPAR